MRWRPLTWFLLSILFFVGAGYFWGLGEKWRAAKQGGDRSLGATNQVAPTPPPKPVAERPIVERGSVAVTAPHASRITNHTAFAYRLTNSTASVGQLARNPKAILLENALFDTAQPVNPAIPAHLRAQGDPGTYIVQARGSIDAAFRSLLADAGASIVSYVPNNAYLVRASASTAQQLAANPQAQSVLPYEPYYKLKGSLLKHAVDQDSIPATASFKVLLFSDASKTTLDEIKATGASVIGQEPSPFGPVYKIQPSPDSLSALAGLPGVQEIELAGLRVPANDLSRATIGAATNTLVATNYLGLTGSNIIVNINDTGVDTNHPDLQGRVFFDSPLSGVDANGHGTHVAGTIAGSGLESTTVTNAIGSILIGGQGTNGQFRGMAPGATLYSLLADPFFGPFFSDSYLQESAAKTNAFISNNSWNYSQSAEYDLAAASYDAAVRDALPLVPGPQPLLFVFSAGNGGAGDNDGTGGLADTIQSPATAKNVITVGALELPRTITTGVPACTIVNNTNVCVTNMPWLEMTDSSDEVAWFSSRGNVGVGTEGEFGRYKPDLVAPGTFVISTRSGQWDQPAYYITHEFVYDSHLLVSNNATASGLFFVPATAVAFNIRLLDRRSPQPFPSLPISYGPTFPPTFVANNSVSVTNPAPNNTYWYYSVLNNSGTQFVAFDVVIDILESDPNVDPSFQVLRTNLNDTIGQSPNYYRYESGTSMAAADVSGTLALMQQFLQDPTHDNPRINGWGGAQGRSPALMKAMLINGARSLANLYDLEVRNNINYQGWGIAQLPSSLPGGLAQEKTLATNAMWLVDQDPTNALATGESHYFNVAVSEAARGQNLPLRVTLVWSDPPANPVTGIKLVNDLNLVVTNLDNPDPNLQSVFFGNDIPAGDAFNTTWDTNNPPNIDFVNNVENVFIAPPLGTNYSITVTGHRVNVNAVHEHPNDVVQDYALVVSCGDGGLTNAIALTRNGGSSNSVLFLTTLTNTFGNSTNYFGQTLSQQRAGANSPLLGTNIVVQPNFADANITIGVTNQWQFYRFTNANPALFPYLRFSVTVPQELSIPRMGVNVIVATNATRPEADIDMYVSIDNTLTNLAPLAVSNAVKSFGPGAQDVSGRSGTATILITNASVKDWYIGVKSEDQMAAEYTFSAQASSSPFNQDNARGRLLYCLDPMVIPDGNPLSPGITNCDPGSPDPGMLIRRVIVTNIISHELMGDLVGVLRVPAGPFVVLNNHSPDGAVLNKIYIYDDSDERDITAPPGGVVLHTAGPGSLRDFAGKMLNKDFSFTMEDNALNHLGTNIYLSVFLERQPPLTLGVTNILQPGACRDDFVEVPANATNLTISAAVISGTGPVTIQVCSPDGTCTAPVNIGNGVSVVIDLFSTPPITPGVWTVITCNNGPDVARVFLLAEIFTGLNITHSLAFTNNTPTNILDDAVTYSTITITNHSFFSSMDVSLLITNAPRISDMAITLIAPNGKRILLFEDRGGLVGTNLGSFSIIAGTPTLGFSYTNMAAFYTNDFEQALVGPYMPPSVFQGSSVITNSVAIVRDLTELSESNNILLLGYGAISNALPTINAGPYPLALTDTTSYQLSFQVTHAPYLWGTIGWWPFDGTGFDIFGAHDGFYCGLISYGAGEVNRAYFSDGLATSFEVARSPDLDVGQQRGFTVEGWIYPTNITNAATLVEWNDPTNASPFGPQFWLALSNVPGSLSAVIYDTNLQPHTIVTPPLVVTNAGWQHVALTYDTNSLTARIYTNGHLVVSQTISTTNFIPRTYGDLFFGYHPPGIVSRAISYAGGLDEFGLYSRALTDCEIAAIAGVTNRGKYETNVLTCPVTNQVQVLTSSGTLTFTFTNGYGWYTNGPTWETNTLSFNNILQSATTNGPPTNTVPFILYGLDPNVAVDNVVLAALVTNTLDGLMHFSEDTNLAVLPIKFAPVPYAISNAPPTLIFSNSFENATQQVYNAGGLILGSSNDPAIGQRNWTNLFFGPVTVVTNGDREVSMSNWLALARGAVQCELPTTPGKKYQLTYILQGPSAAGWWNGDIEPLSARALDLIGGNHGAFIDESTNINLALTNPPVGPDVPARPAVGGTELFLPGMISHSAPGYPDLAGRIELGDPQNLRFTNSFTIEGWIRPIAQTNQYILGLIGSGTEEDNIEQIFFRGDSRQCLDPYYLALEQSDANTFGLLFHIEDANSLDCGLTLEAEGTVFAGQWQHVAAVFERNYQWTNNPPWLTNSMRLYVNGQQVLNVIPHPNEFGPPVDGLTSRAPFKDLDPSHSPGVVIGNCNRDPQSYTHEASEPFRGYIDELSVYARALTDPEIAAIANAGRFGKSDRSVPPSASLAKLWVLIDGATKDITYGENAYWRTQSVTFTALRTNSILTLQSLLPGTMVAGVTLTELPETLTYLPEVDLSPLFGADPFGTWQLEIWDTRSGPGGLQTNNLPILATWQLNFVQLPANTPPTVTLSHCISYTNTLRPGNVQYFIVNMPQWATNATNVLEFAFQHNTAIPTNLGVFFGTNSIPAGVTNYLFWPPVFSGVTNLSTNLVVSTYPIFVGQPYYLAVTNPNPIAVDFAVQVCFDILSLTNCQVFTNITVGPAGIPRYLQFDVPTNNPPTTNFPPQDVVFWLSGLNSNLTVVLSEHLPLPDLAHYDYISERPGTNNEVVMVLTNTMPFPIQSNRWYVGVFNSTATNVPFTAEACYLTNEPVIIPLTNAVPFVSGVSNGSPSWAAPPGPPQQFFFRFTVTNRVSALLFELYNLSGDVDLVLQRDILPGMEPYFGFSSHPRTTNEQIVVRAGFADPDLRGDWYLGVWNNEATNVSYTIRAATPDAGGLLLSGQPVVLVYSLPLPNGCYILQWNAVVGEVYLLQNSPTLFGPWTDVQNVTATTPCPAVQACLSGYYRIVQVPKPVVLPPTLTIRYSPTSPCAPSNPIRISWSTNFAGFTLQYAYSPYGPWIDSALPVTIVNNEYVVCDTIDSRQKYYRLVYP